ncbi:bacteriophage protein [Mycolicibacterium litorale]|uniref:Bacteriophage protein n=1 Tax=Mycolicibacterium litorale TaxID=758802 RepID=A0A6S6PAC3_9MYCO|nr:hypothetical protein [Mycolicibacterium litorale]BCI54936.1 bacteriophage protein [Mycolicibacterium litorale]
MPPKLLNKAEQAMFQNWDSACAALHIPQQGQATRWVLLGATGILWELEGRHRGRQGARMGQLIDGAHHLPFEHLITEGAYQVGATYERSNINKRIISFPVILGGPKYSAHAYRMIETNFWDSLPHDKPFWLGCHTMFGGWRWIEVRLAEVVKTPMKIDSVAFQNNTMQWEIKLLACKPWYAKRMLIERWTAHPETVAARGFDEETISIANRGDMPARFLAMYTGPGRAWIQDGITSRMVELPLLTSKDGYALVDSNEGARTLTGATDPVDNIFYDWIRGSRILDFFLHDIAALGVPVWRRKYVRFTSDIPPRTVANIKVRHDTAGGQVILMMPQRFTRPV